VGHKIKNFSTDEIRSFRRVAPRDNVLLCGVHCRLTDTVVSITHQRSHRCHCPPPPPHGEWL